MRDSNEILQELGLISIERDEAQSELRRYTVTSALDADFQEKMKARAPIVSKLQQLSDVWKVLRTEYEATVKAEEREDVISG
jgi:hypothetical protein